MLLQRDCATRLSVQILQLQNIPFENDCNRQMTLKLIAANYSFALNFLALGYVQFKAKL